MSIHDPLYTWEDHEACWRMNYRGSLGNYVTNNYYYHENADFFDKSIQKQMHTDNTIVDLACYSCSYMNRLFTACAGLHAVCM